MYLNYQCRDEGYQALYTHVHEQYANARSLEREHVVHIAHIVHSTGSVTGESNLYPLQHCIEVSTVATHTSTDLGNTCVH